MRKIALILALAGLWNLSVQSQAPANVAKVKFTKELYDFGKIQHEVATANCSFHITNTGNAPLIIQNVTTSCGCTTTDYNKEPILPGKEGDIKIAYNTVGNVGAFAKKITVFTNVPDTTYVLHIIGEVLPKAKQ